MKENEENLNLLNFRLAVVTLFTFYLNVYLVHKKSMEAVASGEILVSDPIN